MEDSFQNSNTLNTYKVKKFSFNQFKVWIVLGGVLLVLSVLAVIYFYWQYQTTDRLIDLVPVDSMLYVHASKATWPWQKEKISDLPFDNFFQSLEQYEPFGKLSLKNDLLANSAQAAMALILNTNAEFDTVFLFKFKNSNVLELIKPRLNNYLVIDQNTVAISTSTKALDKINKVIDGTTFSLGSQTDSKLLGQGLMTVYLDADNLKLYLSNGQNLADTFFVQLIKEDIYLVFYKHKDQWRFKVWPEQVSGIQSNQNLTKYLPNSFSIYFSNINLFNIFNSWGQVNEDFSEFFQTTVNSLKAVFDFDLASSVESLTNQAVDLIIFNKSDNALGFDYVIILSQTSDKQVSSFEQLVKIILAQKLPRGVDYVLPDGTTVTELLAKPELWQWQTKDGIKYLSEPFLNFEISYLVKDNQMIISSSQELLQSFITTTDIPLANVITKCESFGSYLVFNSGNLFSEFYSFLPQGTVFVSEDLNGRVKGCIIKL